MQPYPNAAEKAGVENDFAGAASSPSPVAGAARALFVD